MNTQRILVVDDEPKIRMTVRGYLEADGFEVLELLGRSIPVVFTTAHDQYALRAFDVHAVDYLLKPFDEARFAEALARARARIASMNGYAAGERRFRRSKKPSLPRPSVACTIAGVTCAK